MRTWLKPKMIKIHCRACGRVNEIPESKIDIWSGFCNRLCARRYRFRNVRAQVPQHVFFISPDGCGLAGTRYQSAYAPASDKSTAGKKASADKT